MRAYRQKNNGFIQQVFTKAILATLNITAFFTDNKDNTKVPVNPDTATAGQIEFSFVVT